MCAYKIGFANLDELNPFAVAVREHLEEAVAQREDIELVVRDNQMDTERARENAHEFAEMGVDACIMFHIDERAGPSIIQPLRTRRIPVISVDIPIAFTTVFGINIETAGTSAGEAMAEWVKANWDGHLDRIMVLTEYRVLEVFQQRFKYAVSAIQQQIDIPDDHILMVDNGGQQDITAERIQVVMNTNWQDFEHIVIVCMNDKIAQGALEAVRALGRENHVAVLSFDGTAVALQEFERPDSRLIVSPSFRPDLYGPVLLDLCMRLITGDHVSRRNYVEPICLTRDNFRELV